MNDAVVTAPAAHGGEYDPLAGWNDGFLGTGNSTLVEIAYILGALIAVYVAYRTARYFLGEASWLGSLAGAIGLKDD